MCSAVLFVGSKTWEPPKCPFTDLSKEDREEDEVYIEHGILFGPKNEGNPACGSNMDERGGRGTS